MSLQDQDVELNYNVNNELPPPPPPPSQALNAGPLSVTSDYPVQNPYLVGNPVPTSLTMGVTAASVGKVPLPPSATSQIASNSASPTGTYLRQRTHSMSNKAGTFAMGTTVVKMKKQRGVASNKVHQVMSGRVKYTQARVKDVLIFIAIVLLNIGWVYIWPDKVWTVKSGK